MGSDVYSGNMKTSLEINKSQQQVKENDLSILETSFFSLPSQGTIYTVSSYVLQGGSQSVVVLATLNKIYLLHYKEAYSVKEIELPFITSEDDISAIDVMPMKNENVFQLGIVLIKKENYEKAAESSVLFCTIGASSVDSFIPIKFESLLLPLLPYQLYATFAVANDTKERVWLLAGSDWSVHLFRDQNSGWSEESNVDFYFPELTVSNDICLHIDICYSADCNTRTSILGGESGSVDIFRVDVSLQEPTVTCSQHLNWDFPVSSCRLFHLQNDAMTMSEVEQTPNAREQPMSALITTTLEGCYVCSDCVKIPANLLANSSADDVVTCSLICDIDFDGENEVIIGTFGKVVSIYDHSDEDWTIVKKLSLPSPVTAIRYEHLTNSGVRDLVIVTHFGVHIYEHDSTRCFDLIQRRFQALTEKDLRKLLL